ncbi:hypothetical protein HG536_0F03570 [Torulaspora globosa]|uniref:TauD/TfdA-like domain-containing protein n=1 Tax=Torulaspora globosa TaxID=48254 RepID=A0A7G3ZKJ6_9SACH|nr:uncharacterized protein HG536_0F03570 [Torulaspora globosa]QLL34032.1 hypothetical protein HG536_0F03570 [Torulaspora globosa]
MSLQRTIAGRRLLPIGRFVRNYSDVRDAATAIQGGKILRTKFDNDSTTVTFITKDSPKHEPFTVTFNNLFLRDSSKSPKSVDLKSGQKLFTTGYLASNPSSTVPTKVEVSPDSQSVLIDWKDGDSYKYSLEFIYKFKGSTFVTDALRNSISKHKPVLWDRKTLKGNIADLNSVNYEGFMNEEQKLYKALTILQKYGLTFINDVPKGDHDAVRKICERIGPIRNTIYGETFDVKSDVTTTSNIAYSNFSLPLHMDLLYLENVPGFQLLHSINNSPAESGGANIFVDAFSAARHVREQDAEGYEAMQHVPVNYQYVRDGNCFYQSRPMIEQYDSNESNTLMSNYEYLIKRVYYSPPFQAPFTLGIYEKTPDTNTSPAKLTERFLFRDFVHGLGVFDQFINRPENQFKLKLPENTCVIFNNTRILHARTAFKSTDRWLKGCYLDRDSFSSKLKYLEQKYI